MENLKINKKSEQTAATYTKAANMASEAAE